MIERGMYRNRRLLDLCHFAPCFLKIDGICTSGRHPSVPAHSNWQRHGRGAYNKSHDVYSVPACIDCHHWLDEGTKADREAQDDAFMSAWERWILHLFRHEFIEVRRKAA